MLAIRIERQHLILHSTLCNDLTIRNVQFVNQRVCVNVVKCIPGWNVGRFLLEDSGEVRVFSVEVQQIGAKTALLQHVTCPSKIVDPRASLLRPGVIAVEPLPKRSKRQPRCFANQRLMCRFVNYKSVDSVQQLLISGRFQRRRRPGPRRRSRRHRLCRRDVLTINVSDGRGLTIVSVVAILHIVNARSLRPHRTHGDFVHLFHFHAVRNQGSPVLV